MPLPRHAGNDMPQSVPVSNDRANRLLDICEKPPLSDEPNCRINLAGGTSVGNEKIDVQLVHENEL